MDEHWGTFSIYDHRTPLYRRALLLFDRVVVPIPSEPYGGLSARELDLLSADVNFLEGHDAAVRFEWNPKHFQEWQRTIASEALARTLNADPLYASRLYLTEEYRSLVPAGVDSVVAVPVYADASARAATEQQLAPELPPDAQDVLLLEVVLPRLPVPTRDAPLEDIIRLRQSDQFREAIYAIRQWQSKVLPEIIGDPQRRDRHLRRAASDFDRWIKQYSEAITDARFAKAKMAVTSILAVGAVLVPFTKPVVAALSAVASPLFSLRELRKPSWKVVAPQECAPAAIVYAASQG
ncbi:MAG: hypothetical protein JO231_21360 [Acidobacteria bacterium]|nr:hypothetical protein [Acidobacteriota bacterium]